MDFDWHDEKSNRNLAERGFGFDFAALIFLGRTLHESDDRRDYGEVRENVLGEIDGEIYHVTFTEWLRAVDHLGPPRQPQGAPAMARINLDELRMNRPQVNRAMIDATTEADIRRHTVEDGGDPDATPTGYVLALAPAEIRKKLGVTQQRFAEVLGVPVATYRNWEQGRKVPDPAARSLLTIFDREPEAAMRALDIDRTGLGDRDD